MGDATTCEEKEKVRRYQAENERSAGSRGSGISEAGRNKAGPSWQNDKKERSESTDSDKKGKKRKAEANDSPTHSEERQQVMDQNEQKHTRVISRLLYRLGGEESV